ncbi:hypothetical protein C9993_12680, partial [Marinobacter sp. Z-F4-2]
MKMDFMNEFGKVSFVLTIFLILAVILESLLSSNIAVVTHAVSVAVLALWYFRQTVPLQKTSVDRIYYSIAALAVALVFIYETPDRQQLDLLSEIRQMGIIIQENAAEEHGLTKRINRQEQLKKAVMTNEIAVLSAVREGAVRAQANTEAARKTFCENVAVLPYQPDMDEAQDYLMLNSNSDVFKGNECKRYEDYARHP